MTLDKLMYEWLAGEVSGLIREGDQHTNVEPPTIEYVPTTFARRAEYGSAESYPNTQIRIRVRHGSDGAYNNDEMDGAAQSVIDTLSGATPSLTGYVASDLELAFEPGAQDNEEITYRDILFLTTISKGFSTTPLVGGDGSVSIVGLAGLALGYQATVQAPVDYRCTSYTDTTENVSIGIPRVTVVIDWVLADSVTPMPVVGSSVSVIFAFGTNFAWVDTMKISALTPRLVTRDKNDFQTIRIVGHVTAATSPFITGDAA